MKKVGELHGMPVYEDPNAPKGKVFFVNYSFNTSWQLNMRPWWRRLWDWIKNRFRPAKPKTKRKKVV